MDLIPVGLVPIDTGEVAQRCPTCLSPRRIILQVRSSQSACVQHVWHLERDFEGPQHAPEHDDVVLAVWHVRILAVDVRNSEQHLGVVQRMVGAERCAVHLVECLVLANGAVYRAFERVSVDAWAGLQS